MLKVIEKVGETFEKYVHPCYYTKTINQALYDINLPVPLSFHTEDPNLLQPPTEESVWRSVQYKFGFEKSSK